MSVEATHSNHIQKIIERDFEGAGVKSNKAIASTSGVQSQARSRDNLNRK